MDYQRVLDSQRFLLQEESNLTETRSSIAVNLIALYKALGGGWELSQMRPIVPERMQREMKERTDWGDLLSDHARPKPERSRHGEGPRESGMSKKISKRALKWIIASAVVAVAAFIGFKYWKSKKSALPEGIVQGNGRLEAKLVDVAAKEPLRVQEVLVDEGALVKPGQVLVRLDTTTLEAELAEANASVAAAAGAASPSPTPRIVKQQERDRARRGRGRTRREPVAESAGSQRELDVRKTKLGTTKATLAEAEAPLQTAKQQVEVARANAATIQTRINDATLKSPVPGRVLYRLAEPGEVLAPGGKALTLVNLEDVYMEIFLPSEQAARVKIGAEARITLDYAPARGRRHT